MPRRGENIYKRKDGRWEGRIWKETSIPGKRSYLSIYGKTYKEAKEKMKTARSCSWKTGKGLPKLEEAASVWIDEKSLLEADYLQGIPLYTGQTCDPLAGGCKNQQHRPADDGKFCVPVAERTGQRIICELFILYLFYRYKDIASYEKEAWIRHTGSCKSGNKK